MSWVTTQPEPHWSEPNYHPNVAAARISASIAAQQERQRQQLQQIPQDLMSGIQKLKNDKIQQQLLEQKAPDVASKYQAMGLTGAAAMKQYLQDQQDQQTSTDQEQKQRWMESRIAASGAPPGVTVNTPWGTMSPTDAVHVKNYQDSMNPQQDDGWGNFDAGLRKNYGITSDDLDKINLDRPNNVKFYSPAGKQIAPQTADMLGNDAYAMVPAGAGGQTKIPYKDWIQTAQTYKNLGGKYQPPQANPAQQMYGDPSQLTPGLPQPPTPPSPQPNFGGGSAPAGAQTGGGPTPGQRVKQNGMVYEYDGTGWNPVQ